MIRTIFKQPGGGPVVLQIPKGLQAMQALVGGPIQRMCGDAVGLSPLIDVWFNEEGKLEQLTPNLVLKTRDGQTRDVLVGPAFFTTNNKAGDTCSLPEAHDKAVLDFIELNTWRGKID